MVEVTATPEERKVRRFKLGVLITPGVGFRNKATIFRAFDKHETQLVDFIDNSLQVYNQMTGKTLTLDAETQEWDWTEFFEFLKWLIPLLIEFIGTLPG